MIIYNVSICKGMIIKTTESTESDDKSEIRSMGTNKFFLILLITDSLPPPYFHYHHNHHHNHYYFFTVIIIILINIYVSVRTHIFTATRKRKENINDKHGIVHA